LIAKEKNKGPKKLMTKKRRKCGDANAKTVVAVAAAAKHAERGVGVRIGDHLTAL
jgi:hypothetical protein